jgi:hypothetical protein
MLTNQSFAGTVNRRAALASFAGGFVHSSVYEQANTISMFQSDATDLFTCFNPLPQP